uniref:Uncharacterized protein n=1 Tax=Anguilla anguilla TaxID=7936 RepID=A0A0E9QYK0_ANGAN
MSTHHLKLNLGKTKLLPLMAKCALWTDVPNTVDGSAVSPIQLKILVSST